ncbi:hypothetical protein JW824_11125 [bacterium]|nr:hypothetical protein [bacterium]
MKRIFLFQIIFSLVLLVFIRLWAAENTLAVLDFENNSLLNPDEYQPLAKGLSEIMITELGQVQAIHVVERQKLKSVIDELKLSQSGLVSENGSIEVGKMLGAEYLVFGSYMVAFDKKIRIDARIVNVETGLTVKASQVTGKEEDLLSLISKLSKKILEDLDVRITKAEEDLFDESRSFEMDSVVLFSKGLELEDQGLWEEAEKCYEKVIEIEPKFKQAIDRLGQLSNMRNSQ